MPAFGQTVTLVMPTVVLTNARRMKPRGHALIFLCLHPSNATWDGSIVVCDLQVLIDLGKIRLWRTRNWRRPPGPPRFALKALAEMWTALRSASTVCSLSDEDLHAGLHELGNSAEAPAEEHEDYELEGIKFFGGPDDEDGEDSDAALAASDAEVVHDNTLEFSEESMPDLTCASADAETQRADFTTNEKAAIEEFKRQKAELAKLSSYEGGFDIATGKATRSRKDSPRPSHIAAAVWNAAGKAYQRQ